MSHMALERFTFNSTEEDRSQAANSATAQTETMHDDGDQMAIA